MGISGAIHSVYVCELVDKRWRGPMTASGVIVITCGLTTAYVVGSIFDYKVTLLNQHIELCIIKFLHVKIEALAFTVFPVLNFIGVAMFVPESPNWLVSKSRPDEARRTLEWLKRDDVNWVTEVMKNIYFL